MPEEIFSESVGTGSKLLYKIDGTDFSTFGVSVLKSKGIQDLPSLKEPVKINWPGSHGTVVDLSSPRYEDRIIELPCFIEAVGELNFFNKVRAFIQAFQKPGLRKLELWFSNKPLIYMVYLADGIEIDKNWRPGPMFGTFTIKLIDPMPVKRLLKVTGNYASITFTSANPIDIFWGDGSSTLGVFGDSVTKIHSYSASADYYILLGGVIEEISSFAYNPLTMVWSKY